MTNLLRKKTLSASLVFCLLLFTKISVAQTYNLDDNASFLEVHGTSSLHDWHVDAETQNGKITVSNLDDLELNALSFSVESESLKSGKSGMDKNTYKALNTDEYKTITFKMSSVKSLELVSDNNYKVSVIGDMTISGVTKSITIDLTLKLKDNKIWIEGEKSIKMTDYGIEPPKALLGTIKTGDDIKIIFKSVFQK
ncbi:YceI family protein [Winogradskyella sp.]|uniref:YceI family protein n=1 Tax=Winogradskyella sp. TaxID=1883156 RepID=UPI001B180180|nr:YceI family protein [Winogradskyella sp.]MBO6880473.1 YceI family protein [Winogradskyella sp.]